MLLVLLLLCIYGAVRGYCQTYDYGVDIVNLTRRKDSDAPITVSQLPLADNGTVPFRPEIREMITTTHRWDLFILALSIFQYVSQDDPTSWYQIAGIHGVPFVSWNKVLPALGANQSGYCTHSSVLFPVWHRPYLALYEQEMYRMVNIIADMFPNVTEKRLYRKAARTFRIPYWDWAANPSAGESYFPEVFWPPVISQYGPNGVQNIKNPLYSYEFDPLDTDAMIWAPLKYWHETKRAPDTNISTESPPSNNSFINEILLSKLPEIQQRLYILFASYKDWDSFSNKAWAESRNATWLDSIEAVHDIIHIYGGYKGHMTYVPLSSFDPLFFFHHAMTDRLVAMWQVLNPDSWIQPMASGETSFNALQGSIQDSLTPLTPFFTNENGDFWNSDLARSTEAFGYAYEDVSMGFNMLASNHRDSLSRKIATWYGTHSPLGLLTRQNSKMHQHHVRRQETWKSHGNTFRPNIKTDAPSPSASLVVAQGRYLEWMAAVKVNVEALDGRFDIHFFIGGPSDDVQTWERAQNQVGSVGIFAMNRTTGSQSKICGTVVLTSALLKMVAAGEISDLGVRAVRPFLSHTLVFRVLGSNDAEVQAELVDGLSISVVSAEARHPDSNGQGLPVFGEAQTIFTMWP